LAQHSAAGTRPLLLWSHDPARPIGVWTSVHEDAAGLRVEGRLTLDARDGADAFALLKAGALNGLSIGFRTRDAERLPGGGRLLKAVDLIEVSVVALPAAPQARVISVKGEHMEDEIEVKDAPAEDTGEVKKTAQRFGTIEATLAKLTGRLDRVEVKANRPGAAALIVSKCDAKAATFAKFIRSGREALDAIECKDLVVSDDTAGGYLAPEQFVAELLKNLVLFSPIHSLARVTNISSGAAVLPRRTGRLTAQWVSEVGPRPETQPSYGQVRYVPNESGCYVDVSATMLEDSAIDISSELSNDFAEEFGRLEGAAFVSGDGVGKPSGFMQSESIAFTPSGSATGITTDALIDLYHALPSPYRANAAWLMNSNTMAAVRKMKTLDGDYLLALAGIQNAPAMLLGRPVVEVPDIAAGSFPFFSVTCSEATVSSTESIWRC